jgi:hypothetical protein
MQVMNGVGPDVTVLGDDVKSKVTTGAHGQLIYCKINI